MAVKLDGTTGLKNVVHRIGADKGDYFAIPYRLPKRSCRPLSNHADALFVGSYRQTGGPMSCRPRAKIGLIPSILRETADCARLLAVLAIEREWVTLLPRLGSKTTSAETK